MRSTNGTRTYTENLKFHDKRVRSLNYTYHIHTYTHIYICLVLNSAAMWSRMPEEQQAS